MNNQRCGAGVCGVTSPANVTQTLTPSANHGATLSGSAPSLTITDDDILAKPGGMYVTGRANDSTNLYANWNAVTDADGYYVDWKSSSQNYDTTNRRNTVTSGSTLTSTITGLTSGTTYTVRVIAYKASYEDSVASDEDSGSPAGIDYDTDNNNLIEIDSLVKLNAIRWDGDGDGSSTDAGYATAYPSPATNAGCSTTCAGYELTTDLDFDTGVKGDRTDDTYYNSGAGWLPIASYSATLEGHQNTLKNLHINRTYTVTGTRAGLFATLAAGSVVSDLYLTAVNVSATSTHSTSGASVFVAGMAGWNQGTVTDSYVTGTITGSYSGTGSGTVLVSGFGSMNAGTVRKSYSSATVLSTNTSSGTAGAGGLVATNVGTIQASYATGDVTVRGNSTIAALAGGLVSWNAGTITAAYATGDVSITDSASAKAGGLTGEHTGTITAAWSGGAVAATAGTVNRGGLVGTGPGTVNNAYWDTNTSGIPDDADTNAPEGKTSSELQTPTAYGTGSALYANWNVNVDGVAGNDDPWDFGTSSQWPVLHVRTLPYVLLTPPTVSWALGNSTIYESTKGGSTRATSTTITPTLSAAWPTDLSFIFPTDAAVYTLSSTEMTVPAGATTATGITLTAVNNLKCGNVDCTGSNASDATVSLSPSSNHLRMSTTVPKITITDDDILVKPTGVKLSVTGTKVRVDWTQVSGATGYVVQWNISDTWTGALAGTATITSGSTTNHTITSGLTSGVTYFFRVIATKTGNDDSAPSDSVSNTPKTGNVDYDSDNDGLIEITTLAQLNAIRWDLDGDGEADSSGNAASYSTAFPDAEANMGCNESVVTVSSNDTGNPTCSGYELDAALDFDTDGSGGPNSGDTYWNSGQGWLPIGATAGSATASAYTGEFDGGTHVISNLYVNRSGSAAVGLAGLFAELGSGAEVSNLKLKGVSVTSATNSSASTAADIYAGGVAGKSAGSVTGSYVIGTVKAVQSDISANTTEKNAYAGGLAGHNTGTVTSSYARATVTAEQKSPTASKNAYAGGLAGYQGTGGAIAASFATGTVTALSESATGAKSYAGGLVGHLAAGSVKAGYSHAHPEAKTAASATTATLAAGGLAGLVASGASVTASYSTGAPTTSGGSSPTTQVGGLAGSSSGTITDSYWDTSTSGVTATGAGTGKTTSELKTPTAYGTGSAIYANWNIDVGGSASVDDPWDFGTSAQYPALDYGLTASAQRAAVTIAISPTSICESAKGTHTNACGASPVTSATLTATLSPAQDVPVTLALNTNTAVYTLKVGNTATSEITIARVPPPRPPHHGGGGQQQDRRLGRVGDPDAHHRPELGQHAGRGGADHQGRGHPRQARRHEGGGGRDEGATGLVGGDGRRRLHRPVAHRGLLELTHGHRDHHQRRDHHPQHHHRADQRHQVLVPGDRHQDGL